MSIHAQHRAKRVSQAPSMPMYWDAYLADTTHLTTEEHGAYMLLIAAMWRRNGSVPDDDKDNARILGLSPAKWRKVKARLTSTISGFRVEFGMITQEKVQKTWKITQEKIDKNRLNGAMGGRAASSKNNDLGQADAANSQERNLSIPEPEPEPEPYKEKRDTKVSPKKRATRLPADWVLSRACGEWAVGEGYSIEAIRIEAEKFKDYWIGVGGTKGTKLDWPATWRNWIRNSKQGTHNGNGNSNSKRRDPALEQIARLTGLSATSGDGGL
jgi:uncharacterized protein YdaU (DUF1376 family)